MRGLVSHVVNSLHQAEVEKGKAELTTLGTVTEGKKSSTEKAQWNEIRGASSRQSGCESPKKCLENILDNFDESSELEGIFQSMVEHYKDVFDDSIELKPMIGPE